jgi:hypothetical protein
MQKILEEETKSTAKAKANSSIRPTHIHIYSVH